MKKILSSVLAAAMVASVASVSAFAAAPAKDTFDWVFTTAPAAYNDDGEVTQNATVTTGDGEKVLTIDPLRPGVTVYIPLKGTSADVGSTGRSFDMADFDDKKVWSVSLDKDEGSKLVKSVTIEAEKDIKGSGIGRTTWIKIVTNDTTSTSEQKFAGTLELKAKKTVGNDDDGYTMVSGDIIKIPLTFWISNKEVKNDDNPDVGERVYVNPTKNDTNTIVWGDERAALTFDSNDDAGKFYARLNTKNDAAIWREYADPVDADLWFYEFVGSSTIPATSRATLTLGIPWDDDDDYAIDPEDAYIYEKDADGRLIDVTSKFTYSEDDAEIPGWSIKTRTLGTYIVSDTELDLDIEDEDEDVSEAEETGKTTTGAKPIPDTGASDMVNVAVVAGIVSLAAAGAVAFRKAK